MVPDTTDTVLSYQCVLLKRLINIRSKHESRGRYRRSLPRRSDQDPESSIGAAFGETPISGGERLIKHGRPRDAVEDTIHLLDFRKCFRLSSTATTAMLTVPKSFRNDTAGRLLVGVQVIRFADQRLIAVAERRGCGSTDTRRDLIFDGAAENQLHPRASFRTAVEALRFPSPA
jgi:hypothetical protein